jgi:hypothetical protein
MSTGFWFAFMLGVVAGFLIGFALTGLGRKHW